MADRVYPVVIRAAKLGFRALGLRFEMSGLENLPETGGYVLAGNHVSFLDFIFCGLAPWDQNRRFTRFMAKEVIFRHRLSGPLMRGMHHIAVDRDAGSASLRAALKALKAGEIVGVFPEATISRSLKVKELKSGAVRMAAAARVPVVPVAVWGGHLIYGKGGPRRFGRRTTIAISVGQPITVSTRDDMVETTEALRATLQSMLDVVVARHPDTPNPPPGAWWLPADLGGSAPTPEAALVIDHERAVERRAKRDRRHALEAAKKLRAKARHPTGR